MQRSLSVVLYILASLLITSCSKVDSLFNNGEPITVQREVDQVFHSISMYNNVNVKLVHDNHPHLELTCPENLIEKVTTVVEDGVLTVKNENDYNWLRSYDYSIDLTIYYDSISAINYASVGDLFSTDTIRGYGKREIDTTESGFHTLWTRSFYININEGCGDIDLAVKCNVFKTNFNNGTSEVTLRGLADYTEIFMRSYGIVHAEKLYSNFVRVMSESTNDAYVWFGTKLTVWIKSIGNIYYKGKPSHIEIKQHTGDGEIIKLE